MTWKRGLFHFLQQGHAPVLLIFPDADHDLAGVVVYPFVVFHQSGIMRAVRELLTIRSEQPLAEGAFVVGSHGVGIGLLMAVDDRLQPGTPLHMCGPDLGEVKTRRAGFELSGEPLQPFGQVGQVLSLSVHLYGDVMHLPDAPADIPDVGGDFSDHKNGVGHNFVFP